MEIKNDTAEGSILEAELVRQVHRYLGKEIHGNRQGTHKNATQ